MQKNKKAQEREKVLDLLNDGESRDYIVKKLKISPQTVDAYRAGQTRGLRRELNQVYGIPEHKIARLEPSELSDFVCYMETISCDSLDRNLNIIEEVEPEEPTSKKTYSKRSVDDPIKLRVIKLRKAGKSYDEIRKDKKLRDVTPETLTAYFAHWGGNRKNNPHYDKVMNGN
ncbi:MAG: hypothetical protein CMH64_02710 [Nanoarchaeota archaeon]|nr:hypothetical protein [Nanoarchaeota archaeon]|tara:strand:+ start:5787 stop:6302 length:516 start_codon:yes stop_codon:yes gene_type:complete